MAGARLGLTGMGFHRKMRQAALMVLASAALGLAAEPAGRSQPHTTLGTRQRASTNHAHRRRARMAKTLRQLGKIVDHVEFEDEALTDVLAWFRERGLQNLVVHWKAIEQSGSIDRDTPISLALEEVPLAEILDVALGQASASTADPAQRLTYHVLDGIVKISTKRDFNRQVYTRTYLVENLLYRITLNSMLPFIAVGQQVPYVRSLEPVVAAGAAAQRPQIDVIHSGTRFGPGQDQNEQPDFESMREEELEKLIELLRAIHPESWRENGGRGTIAAHGSQLVVTQTIEMHEIIGGAFSRGQTRAGSR